MLRVARIVCPLVALLIVVALVGGVRGYDPEPGEATVAGWVLLIVLAAAAQAPLALAPYVPPMDRDVRTVVTLAMLPSAASILLAGLDLLPLLVDPRTLSPAMVGLLGAAAVGYVLGFLVLHRARAG